MDAERGDIYAAAAGASALHDIDQAVMDAHARHVVKKRPAPPPQSTPQAVKALRNARDRLQRLDRYRAETIQQALDQIYRFTQDKSTELEHRRSEFQSKSLHHVAATPDREALGGWLQARAEEARDSEMVHSYFTQLAQALAHERDPWTVSRELMSSLPNLGDALQAGQLQAAHERLVRAIACGLSERPAGSEPPDDFRFRPVYEEIVAHCERDKIGADPYAAAASEAALYDIDLAITDAHFEHGSKGSPAPKGGTLKTLHNLYAMRSKAKRTGTQSRVEAIQRTMDHIHRITYARHAELERRSNEFRSAFHAPGASVLDRDALARWLRSEAVAAPGTEIEHSYFTELEQRVPVGTDPWMVSQELMRSLPSPGDKTQVSKLQVAHLRLVHAMTGSPPEPAPVPPPGAAPASGEGRAPVSMQQEVIGRLNSRDLLSDGQVQAILAAVGRAVDAGTLSVSTCRPEGWARRLVDRVQASVRWPVGELTETERERESADLKALGELIGKLGEQDDR